VIRLGPGLPERGCQAAAGHDDSGFVSSGCTPRLSLASSLELGHSADYKEFVDGQFMALALREGLLRMRGLGWPSEFATSIRSARSCVPRLMTTARPGACWLASRRLSACW
jgi:hypothetical protein